VDPRVLVKRGVRAGAVGGIVVVYLAAVGMIEQFNVRNLISDVVTLGKLMLALPAFVAGYLAVRPRVRRGGVEQLPPSAAVVIGAVAGAVTGLLTVIAVVLVHVLGVDSVRTVFISVSPTLLDIVAFGQSVPVAAVILILGGAALGALGGEFRSLPNLARRPLTVGLFTTFLMALLQRIIPPALFQLGMDTSWLYSVIFLGLTVFGAVAVFVVSTVIAFLWRWRRDQIRERVRSMSSGTRVGARGTGLLVAVGVMVALPQLIGDQLSQVLGTVAVYVLLGLGLNIVVGYAGLLDLGYVAFYAVGAYATAVLTGGHLVISLGGAANPAVHADFSFYAALPLVVVFAAFIGLLIGAPVLRLRGDYLAIVTLGFGEIVRILVQSDWLQPLLGGAQGVRDVTTASLLGQSFSGTDSPKAFYYLALAFCVLAIYVSARLADSRIGRAWNAMREDEQVAEAMGISTVKYKLLAFGMGAAVGCLGGALFAVQIGSLNPGTSFTILVSITVLAVIILGGMGSIPGVVVGALALIGIPNLLSEFEQFKLLLYGAVLILIMILRPEGLIPNVRRLRELHEEEREQDAWLKRTGDASVDTTVAVGSGGEKP
jgi:branched-chain amino acid transport system permease protein